jgi:hypothetical protein
MEVRMVSSAQRARQFTANPAGTTAAALRDEVAAALERFSQFLLAHSSRAMMMGEPAAVSPGIRDIQESVKFLGQVIAAWTDVPDDALPAKGAGFGSTIVVEDLDQGVRERFTLMTGAMLDVDAGHVSLASPIGHALLGAVRGDVVNVQTPHRLRRLHVVEVRTLQQLIEPGRPLPAA